MMVDFKYLPMSSHEERRFWNVLCDPDGKVEVGRNKGSQEMRNLHLLGARMAVCNY